MQLSSLAPVAATPAATTAPYIGTAVGVVDDPDAMGSNLWTMRIGNPLLGAYSTIEEARTGAEALSAGDAPGIVLVKEGDVIRPFELVARNRDDSETYEPWAFADEQIPGDLYMSTQKHANANGVVGIIDAERGDTPGSAWDLYTYGYGG